MTKEYYLEEKGIYYRMNEFNPERLTLVFAHGASGSSSAWIPYEKIFENKYNILFYDIRGHGKSKKYPNYEDYAVKNFTTELHDLITYLKIEKFILISNSFACLIHLEYLKQYPGTIIANVFTSPEIYLTNGLWVKIIRAFLKLTIILKLIPFNPKIKGQINYTKHIGSTDWDISRNLADIRNTGLHAHFYTLRQSFLPSNEYSFEQINIPTLIVHGEKDSMIPIKNSILLAKKIKNSQFVSIPNVDHNTVHNGVKIISEAMESFIEKNKARFS
ncbi:MAG: alpha/beta hydrolase [bacterium]